jgi:predicted nucleic acid-binding protein
VIAYLDSSAIAKLYLDDEVDTDILREIVTGSTLVTSRLSYVEVRSSLAAAHRGRRLSAAQHDRAADAFEEAWSAYVVIDLTDGVSRRAGAIAEVHGLRAGDAIQLASALEADAEDAFIVAWDVRLRSAATRAGVPVYPVDL